MNQIARALLIWLPIPDDVWNGDRLNYIVVVADVTPDFSRQFEYEVDYDVTSLEVTKLQVSNVSTFNIQLYLWNYSSTHS